MWLPVFSRDHRRSRAGHWVLRKSVPALTLVIAVLDGWWTADVLARLGHGRTFDLGV